MKIAVAKEVEMGERRVALIPEIVVRLFKQGHDVLVEAGAGVGAEFSDADYEA
ncbi:MAG: NAD(P)(+) transhydrogenase (Re/Si-specific) subunit alpha, partial [Microcoleus sp. SIO2G3]|nr:NAD(P)(+) transhydrogenase (Re/Si-specific) subunit alpha [Microcoleus sp. SIO2G3]